VVNAGGPWSDKIIDRFKIRQSVKVVRSKGIHIVLPRLNKDCAIAIETEEGKHFFIIPWLDYTLIGTTDTPFHGSLDEIGVTKDEAADFLNLVNQYYPIKQSVDNILHSYAGVRPLVFKGENKGTYTLSRKHEVIDHNKIDKVSGLISIIGGKWTTSRNLAEQTVNLLIKKYKFNAKPCQTRVTAVSGGKFQGRFNAFRDLQIEKYKDDFDSALIHRLVSYYGAKFTAILEIMKEDPKLKNTIEIHGTHTFAELYYAVKKEQCLTISDFIFRRSSMGNFGIPSLDALHKIATFIAELIGWNQQKIDQEIELIQKMAALL
jgi:glycerol-3-phosphate dehydrogenase